MVVEDEINAKQGGGTQRTLQTLSCKSQTAGRVAGPPLVLDFSADLLFGSIDWVSYAEVDPSSTENSEGGGGAAVPVALVGAAERHGGQGGNKRPCLGTVHGGGRGTDLVSHWSARLNGTAVKVAQKRSVSGTVHMEVAECSR